MDDILTDLTKRFGAPLAPPPSLPAIPPAWPNLAARGSCRQFAERPVDDTLIELLAALALSSPS